MGKIKVVFEGESFDSEDDKELTFDEATANIPEDFMERMFKYLESDMPYEVLYQIKSVIDIDSEKELDTKPYVAVVGEKENGEKGAILLKEINEKLALFGQWNVVNVKNYIKQVYDSPELFEIVVVTISTSNE